MKCSIKFRPQVTTAAATKVPADRPGTPSSAGGGRREGQAMSASTDPLSLPLSGECEPLDYDYVQELIKVAPPALARLLSFEHLR